MTAREPEFYFSNDPELSRGAVEALTELDTMPAVFEWYQHVGLTVHFVACISDQSAAYRIADPSHWAVLRGMLHRCSRLMLANVALTHQGVFGDAAKIFDRCIFETAIKARWLCQSGEFVRYLGTSLKPEYEFKRRLVEDVERRGGTASPIQSRMLASIERHRWLAGVSWDEVVASKKLPPINAMLSTLNVDPMVYIVSQQLGSHAIHGSWSSLLDDYLYVDDAGGFELRDHDVEPHPAQFAAAIQHVLNAAIDVVLHAFAPPDSDELADDIRGMKSRFDSFYRQHHAENDCSREDE